MPFRIGPTELIVILAVLVFIFGAKRLPQIGGSMGKAIRGFQRGFSGAAEGITQPGLEMPNGTESGSSPKHITEDHNGRVA